MGMLWGKKVASSTFGNSDLPIDDDSFSNYAEITNFLGVILIEGLKF